MEYQSKSFYKEKGELPNWEEDCLIFINEISKSFPEATVYGDESNVTVLVSEEFLRKKGVKDLTSYSKTVGGSHYYFSIDFKNAGYSSLFDEIRVNIHKEGERYVTQLKFDWDIKIDFHTDWNKDIINRECNIYKEETIANLIKVIREHL